MSLAAKGAPVLARRRSGPAPETKRAILHCDRGCGWVRHEFVARQPVHLVVDGFPSGAHVMDQLIFSDAAGHERVWGNEGAR